MKLEYIYKKDGIVNLIVCKSSQNSKIGFGSVVQTYHFSKLQVKTAKLELDGATCLDCPLRFKLTDKGLVSGGCYTHKGLQRLGLNSMLKRLNKIGYDNISEFDAKEFQTFLIKLPKVNLVRFGAYGEPIHLGYNVTTDLATKGIKTTGYTHQWKKGQFEWSSGYFMASVHSDKDADEARNLGFRSFKVLLERDENSVNCPASKESGKKATCISCGLCNGMKEKGSKKDIYILQH